MNSERVVKKLVELGGKKLGAEKPASRYGQTPGNKHSSMDGDPLPCFGMKIQFAWRKGRRYTLGHYTSDRCRPACLFKSIVVCRRVMKVSRNEHITTHIAGDCPYTNYRFRADVEKERRELLGK